MIRWIFLFSSVMLLFACNETGNSGNNTEPVDDEDIANIIRNPVSAVEDVDPDFVPKITFEEVIFDFGDVKEGEVLEHVFKFTNTGEIPLLIGDAETTCGCTVPTFPKEYIKPGKGGEIKVVFNSKNFTGNQTKPIRIVANTYPRDTKLHIKANVIGNNKPELRRQKDDHDHDHDDHAGHNH